MEQFQFVVFRFRYSDDLVCLWPVFFAIDQQNHFGQKEKEILERAINELGTYPFVNDARIIFNKIANLQECITTMENILATQPNDDSVMIKYLGLERQTELVSEPRFDYTTSSYYIPVKLSRIQFPVRVRANNFKFLLDDIELPILVLREQR